MPVVAAWMPNAPPLVVPLSVQLNTLLTIDQPPVQVERFVEVVPAWAMEAAPKAPIGSLRALWPFVRRHLGLFTGWLLALACSSAATLSLPVAFRRMIGEMNSEVFVANADGSNPRNLTNHPSFEGWPAWSPDSRQIAFAGNRNSSYQIFVMKADGSDVRLVANTEGRATAPKWSPDGQALVFTTWSDAHRRRGCWIEYGQMRQRSLASVRELAADARLQVLGAERGEDPGVDIGDRGARLHRGAARLAGQAGGVAAGRRRVRSWRWTAARSGAR